MNKAKLDFEEIKKLHTAGKLVEAKAGYLALLKDNPQNVNALHMLGILYAEIGQLEDAQHVLEDALELKPDDPTLLLHLANILKAAGMFSKAIQILQGLTQSHPKFAAAYNNLGTVYFAQAKLKEAIQAYQIAIDTQSNYADAYYNLGLALTKANRIDEALNVYKSLLELAPHHAGARFQLARLYMQRRELDLAIEQFKIIEKEHTYHFETQTNLATSYLQQAKLNEAKAHYLKALDIVPDDLQVIFNLGVINVQQGHIREAIDYYLKAVKLNADYYDAHNNLAFLYLTMKDRATALLHFREALRIQPKNEAIRHTINILTQEKNVTDSPPEYIRSLFDSYADHFDAHLLQGLHYEVPQLIYQIVSKNRDFPAKSADILDLGCGTGLSALPFKPVAHSLIGVDLSPEMLKIAREKQIYDALFESDIVTFLQDKHCQYDLVIAGDVLVYTGDLAAVFTLVRQALKENGLFVFDVEVSDSEDYFMTPSGRFAHHQRYIEQLLKENHFAVLESQTVTLRTQDQEAVKGYLYLVQRES